MPDLLSRVQTIKDTPYFIKLLLYGPMGAGKTRFTASAPNPVWIDVERSAETFRRIPEFAEIPIFKPTSFDEMFQFARDVVRAKKYQTIVIDTIGRAQDNQVASLVKSRNKDPLPLWGDYRISTNLMDEMFVFLQDAPVNVVIICHDKIDMDPETKAIVRISPDLTPTLRKAITGLINVVAYLEVTTTATGTRERKLTVNPIGKIEAKNRLNIQESTIKNPTFEGVFLSD